MGNLNRIRSNNLRFALPGNVAALASKGMPPKAPKLPPMFGSVAGALTGGDSKSKSCRKIEITGNLVGNVRVESCGKIFFRDVPL